MGAQDLLILNYDEFATGVERLYQELDTSAAFREFFCNNPAAALHRLLFPGSARLDAAQISYGNRLLFALLSNPNFERWSRNYGAQLERQFSIGNDPEGLKHAMARLDRETLYKDIIGGIQEHGDLEVFYAILSAPRGRSGSAAVPPIGPISPPPAIDIAVEIEILIYAIAAAAVFVIPVDFFFASTKAVSRADLQRISSIVATDLKKRAHEKRGSGALLTLHAVDR